MPAPDHEHRARAIHAGESDAVGADGQRLDERAELERCARGERHHVPRRDSDRLGEAPRRVDRASEHGPSLTQVLGAGVAPLALAQPKIGLIATGVPGPSVEPDRQLVDDADVSCPITSTSPAPITASRRSLSPLYP